MQVAANRVVHIHYTLKTDEGQVVDSSEGNAPLGYVHGSGSIIPGLEKALDGRNAGDRFEVSLTPEEGYGPRHEGLVQSVPLSAFEGLGELQPGMQFQAQTNEGPRVVTIAQVGDESVTVDGNHPLAGQNLNFEIEVDGVREASQEERNDGQVREEDDSAPKIVGADGNPAG